MDISDEIATLGMEMQMHMNRSERRRQRKQQCCNCWKSFLAFLFSHIGLAAMVVAYSIMGGFLFQALEAPYEEKIRYGIRQWKDTKIEEIHKLAVHLSLNNLDKDNFTERVRTIFLEFQMNVTRHVKDNGWDGNDDTEEASVQWSFAGALLYAVTVITTIGYGHVAPKTTWGRLLTIVYALVGIPLTFLYLSNIGNFMADCFRLFYKNICCDLCCCQRCERKRKRERAIARRRKAAQRNSLLRQPPPEIGYQAADELDPECHSLRDEIHLAIEDIPPDEQTEEDRDDQQNNDDIEQAAGGTDLTGGIGGTLPPPYQATVTDETLPVRETAILDDNFEDEYDGIKETAILDSDTDDDDDGEVKNKIPQTPIIDWDNIENFADARETAILDDDEDDDEEGVFLPTSEALPAPALNGGASDDMDTIPLASATDEVNEDDNKSKKKRKRSKSRSKSRETKEQKLAEKRREKERKEREKKEKERLKRERKETEKESKKNRKTKRDRSKEKKGSAKSQSALLVESMDNSGFAHDDDEDNTLSKDSRQNSKTAEKDTTVSDSSKSNDKSKTSGENSLKDSKKGKNSIEEQNDACAESSKGCDDATDIKNKKDSDKKKNSDKKKDTDKKKVKEKVKERPSSLKEKTRFDNKVTMLGKSRDKPTSRSLKEHPHSILKDRSPSRKTPERLSPSIVTPTALFPLPHPIGIPVHTPPAKEGKLGRGKSTKKSFKRKDAQKAIQRREIMKMLILEGARREMLKAQAQKQKSANPHSTKRSFSAEDMNHLGSTSSDLKNNDRHYGSDESFVTAKSESFVQDESPSSPDHTSEKLLPGEDGVVTTQPDSSAVSIDQTPYDLFDLSKDSGALGYDDPFDFGESEQQEKVTVPISICLIIIAGYIFGGSMLFALWEEWDYLTGSYFCFITLSTIGFGDIVPGTDVSDWGSHEKLVLCALWLAFGLSLLAMCFNLMQEEVKEKCKWVGQKLGLLRDDDDA